MPSDPDARRAEADDADNRLATWRSKPGQKLAQVVVDTSDRVRSKADSDSAPWVVLAVIAAVGMAVGVALTAVSAEIYDDVDEGDGIAGLDEPILDQMVAWRSPGLNTWVTHFTDLGSTEILPFLAVAMAGGLVWLWKRWTPVLLLAIASGGGLLMTVVGKSIVGRARPDQDLAVAPFETSPSFPSGHTMNTWVIFAAVAYLVVCRTASRATQVCVVAGAVAVGVAMGMSRVYLGHHWFTDVLMAWTLGTAWLVVVITAHRLALTVIRHRRDDPPLADA